LAKREWRKKNLLPPPKNAPSAAAKLPLKPAVAPIVPANWKQKNKPYIITDALQGPYPCKASFFAPIPFLFHKLIWDGLFLQIFFA
jgi:hypothetical protein